ncbi:hypothetical protein DICVIV_10870 [Dictyocaulus viviparus]|uniref:IRG-type G domain-containing protein n=1 Tax=Dictyocaulus viviparus TaxID=29172 RepID=A0A0D8XH91_DICVI|nr:hypothetical protein DICVIV_10870 [Dictyocaulus viviparus]
MGSESSKSRLSDHVALPNSTAAVPNIINHSRLSENKNVSELITSARVPLEESDYHSDPRETMVLAGTPPPDRPPPPPPIEAHQYRSGGYIDENTITTWDKESNPPSLPPTPAPRVGFPVIKRNIMYAKDRISQFEALNTTDRPKPTKEPQNLMKNFFAYDQTPKFSPFSYAPLTESSASATLKSNIDEYPIYSPVSDFTFKSGMTFQQGTFPIDATRANIGFCGRQGAGKSTLINAIRGLTITDPQAAGRHPCNKMEPFRPNYDVLDVVLTVSWKMSCKISCYGKFPIHGHLHQSPISTIGIWVSIDSMSESHKLNLFRRVFLLIADGAPHDDDISFARIIHSRRTPITMLSTKSDDDLDAEAREFSRSIDSSLKNEYETRARNIFLKSLMVKAQILTSTEVLLISSPVVKNLVSGTIGYLHYKLDEEKLLNLVDIQPGCHYALENQLRKNKERARDVSSSFPPRHIQKSTVLADAGFEILYGTDDRVFGNFELKSTVRRAGRTAFNYGFIGRNGVGKSSMINAMRGMSLKHPLAAGKTRIKRGSCERFEFDDDLLKYSVTLWELHYPRKISAYFEFIDRYNIASFTAIFVLIDETPSDEDLSFSKIAYRRNASVVFLSSKSDRKLAARSRSDEIPVCDLLKQRFVDKGLSRFDRSLASSAPELCGRVHVFFVSAPVFRALRVGDYHGMQFILHERAVFDFLKQKRIVADLLDSPEELKEGLHTSVNIDTAGVTIKSS